MLALNCYLCVMLTRQRPLRPLTMNLAYPRVSKSTEFKLAICVLTLVQEGVSCKENQREPSIQQIYDLRGKKN